MTFSCSLVKGDDGRWCVSIFTAAGVHVFRRRGSRWQALAAAMRALGRIGVA